MITQATIGYRLPGEEPRTATFEVRARTEKEAFDQAAHKLRMELIERALGLRPWAERYSFE